MKLLEIEAAVVTVSDSRSLETDRSGDILVELLRENGANVRQRRLVTDDLAELQELLINLTDNETVELIMTTGGTGFSPRDNTPEATLAVIDREAPGLAEMMRAETSKINRKAYLSRGVCGIRKSTLIVNLPGSPKGVAECFEVLVDLLPHALRVLKGNPHHG